MQPTAQEKIQNYLSAISHGVITISEQHANAIILFATGADYVSTVIVSKWSSLLGRYEMNRTVATTDELIDKYASTSFMGAPGPHYKYHCLYGYGAEVTLYSNQCSLFD